MSVKLIKEEKEFDFRKELRAINREMGNNIFSKLIAKAAKLSNIDLSRVIKLDDLSDDKKAFNICKNNFSASRSLNGKAPGETVPLVGDKGMEYYEDNIDIDIEIGKVKKYPCIHYDDHMTDTFIISPDLYDEIKS